MGKYVIKRLLLAVVTVLIICSPFALRIARIIIPICSRMKRNNPRNGHTPDNARIIKTLMIKSSQYARYSSTVCATRFR